MVLSANQKVIKLLRRIGDSLDILGESRFRVQAYHRAAENIEELDQDVVELWQSGHLEDIPGVGEAIARKLEEVLHTGHLRYYDELQAQVPPGVVDMLAIPDVGPKTARILWQEGGLTSIDEVRLAAEAGRIRQLPGLGERSEAKILAGVRSLSQAHSDTHRPGEESDSLMSAVPHEEEKAYDGSGV